MKSMDGNSIKNLYSTAELIMDFMVQGNDIYVITRNESKDAFIHQKLPFKSGIIDFVFELNPKNGY